VSLTARLAVTKESAYLTIKAAMLSANVTAATLEYHAFPEAASIFFKMALISLANTPSTQMAANQFKCCVT